MITEKSKFTNVKTLIFDMDGVITSERKYWEAAGLTVAEILESENYLGLDPTQFQADAPPETLQEKSKRFVPDELILRLKNRAINTNWDIAYLTVALYLIDLLKHTDFKPSEILSNGLTQAALVQLGDALRGTVSADETETRLVTEFLEADADLRGYALIDSLNAWLHKHTGVEGRLFSRGDGFWKLCQDVFQEWYLGDDLFEATYGKSPIQVGKTGLIQSETPIRPVEKIDALLSRLSQGGYQLGIGTGRPYAEIVTPLQNWGLLGYFDRDRIGTHRTVERGEANLAKAGIEAPLSKPSPFVFLKAIHPALDDVSLYRGEYPAGIHSSVAVIGDTVSDIRAAKQIHCRTIAVLTGIGGAEARPSLAAEQPDAIVKDVLDVSRLFRLEDL